MHYNIFNRTMAPLLRVRFWMAAFIFDRFVIGMAKNEEWVKTLFGTLSVNPGQYVLVLGSHSSAIATSLSKMFPKAHFTVGDQIKPIRTLWRRHIPIQNLRENSSSPNLLSFNDHTFHQVVCFFALHERTLEDKLELLKEVARFLRRGGFLYTIELDKPENDQESKMLRVAGRKSRTAVISHLLGTWLSSLKTAGLSQVHDDLRTRSRWAGFQSSPLASDHCDHALERNFLPTVSRTMLVDCTNSKKL